MGAESRRPRVEEHKHPFFNSIKKINRLISKGMSNIYLKVTIEKN